MITLLSIFVAAVLVIYFLIPLGVTLLAAKMRRDWPIQKILVMSSCLMPILTIGFTIFSGFVLVIENSSRIDTLDDAPQRGFFIFTIMSTVASAIGFLLGNVAGRIAIRWSSSR